MNKMGIWLDHKKAIVVMLDDANGACKINHVESGAESNFHFHGGWKSSGSNIAQSIVHERTAEERRKHQYHDFYQKIIKVCNKPGHLFIFGPAEAKLELKKEIDKIKQSALTVDDVEACDRLSEHEIISKVKEHYHMAA